MTYGPSPIKRQRSTKADLRAFEASLLALITRQQPMTVRQAFYRATVYGIVEKTEAGYRKVQRVLADLRRHGGMPWSWLVDTSRLVIRADSFESPEEAARATARFYRKALWTDADCRVEVWLEKDALSGVVGPITEDYDVGLYICRGFASLSFLHVAAEVIRQRQVPTFIYHIGDFDPSGVMAGQKIADTIRQFAPKAQVKFERLAVTREQIASMRLPSRPTKESNHARGWEGESVEVDAIEPDVLRSIVRFAIERHLPRHQWEVMKAIEQSERQALEMWARSA